MADSTVVRVPLARSMGAARHSETYVPATSAAPQAAADAKRSIRSFAAAWAACTSGSPAQPHTSGNINCFRHPSTYCIHSAFTDRHSKGESPGADVGIGTGRLNEPRDQG